MLFHLFCTLGPHAFIAIFNKEPSYKIASGRLYVIRISELSTENSLEESLTIRGVEGRQAC